MHRDLEPSKVLIDANVQPRETDFGLAKRMAATRSAAHTQAFDVSAGGAHRLGVLDHRLGRKRLDRLVIWH